MAPSLCIFLCLFCPCSFHSLLELKSCLHTQQTTALGPRPVHGLLLQSPWGKHAFHNFKRLKKNQRNNLLWRENSVKFKIECPDVNIGTSPCPSICELLCLHDRQRQSGGAVTERLYGASQTKWAGPTVCTAQSLVINKCSIHIYKINTWIREKQNSLFLFQINK